MCASSHINKIGIIIRLTPPAAQSVPAFWVLEEQASRISLFVLSLCLDTERQNLTNPPKASHTCQVTHCPSNTQSLKELFPVMVGKAMQFFASPFKLF